MNQSRRTLQQEAELMPASFIEEQVRTLYESIPVSVLVSLILAGILTFSEFDVISKHDLMIWNITVITMAFLRLATWSYWRNVTTTISSERWLLMFRLGAVFAGITWGTSSLFMFAAFHPEHQALLAFTLAGVASGSLTTLSVDKPIAIIFVILSVIPLSLRLHFDHGSTAIPMSIMTVFFIFFVLSASNRASRELKERFESNRKLFHWGAERAEAQIISNIINHTQTLFINNNLDRQVFSELLTDTLKFSESEFGFIGEVFYDAENKPKLKMLEMTNISWDKASADKYEKHLTSGMEFSNKNSLIGATLYNLKPMISNSPTQDMRACGTPSGHPLLTAFLGIPILHGTQLVGMLGLANNPSGYTEDDVETYKPITQLIAQIIIARRHHQQHMADEQKILKHLRHTQAILDDAFDAIITTDKNGFITSFNHAAETIFGYKPEQIIGKNVSTLMPAPYRDQHGSHMNRYNKSGNKIIIGMARELKGVRKNGKEFPLEIAVSEVREVEEVTFIAMIKDISERKHIDKLKNDFITTASHDLRTPLTSISASLALLDSESFGQLPDKIKNLVNIARQNSNRLERLIRDLLDMDKLINDKLELHIQAFDLLSVLEKAITQSTYLSTKYQVNFKIASAEPCPSVMGDSARTLQILDKLLSNAAKFSPIHSFVEVGLVKNKHSVRVNIIDYGKGILPEHLETIFHRFSMDNSTPSQSDGQGLGLSLCKELIEKMGGVMGVTSQLNQGSCFYFELPLAQPSPNE